MNYKLTSQRFFAIAGWNLLRGIKLKTVGNKNGAIQMFLGKRTMTRCQCSTFYIHQQCNLRFPFAQTKKMMAYPGSGHCSFDGCFLVTLLLMEEILRDLLYMKPDEKGDILNVNWCRISSINNSFLKSTNLLSHLRNL